MNKLNKRQKNKINRKKVGHKPVKKTEKPRGKKWAEQTSPWNDHKNQRTTITWRPRRIALIYTENFATPFTETKDNSDEKKWLKKKELKSFVYLNTIFFHRFYPISTGQSVLFKLFANLNIGQGMRCWCTRNAKLHTSKRKIQTWKKAIEY